jgi:hypothetical protein
MTKTPEGFLVCHDVPINRIGTQKYYGWELGLTGDDSDRLFDVLRRPEVVFDSGVLASFEGKPITNEHPPDEHVTPDNIHAFECGHAQNVRKGTGPNEGCSIADLYITDSRLIEEVENGKREISCGYNYNIAPNKNGTFEQISMCGNHIAVVDKGRAGSRIAIKDSEPKKLNGGKKMSDTKGNLWGRVIKSFAKDEDTTPDDLEEVTKLRKGADDEFPAKEEPKKEPEEAKDELPQPDETKELLKGILGALAELKTALAPKEAEDDLDSLIGGSEEREENEEGGIEDPEEQEPSVTVSPEEIDEDDKRGAMDSARNVAAGIRKILQENIKDPKAYKIAAKDAATEIRKAYNIGPADNSGYSAFIRATSEAGKKRAALDSKPSQAKINEDVQSGYDALNPHNHKEGK